MARRPPELPCAQHPKLLQALRRVRRAQQRTDDRLAHDLELIGQGVDDLVEQGREQRQAVEAAQREAHEAKAEASEIRGMAARFRRDLWIGGAVLIAVLGAGWKALAWELEPPPQAVALAGHVLARHAAVRGSSPTTAARP